MAYFYFVNKPHLNTPNELTAHFFREEYGKIIAVIARYLGTEQVQTAEDIVQETLLRAADHWEQNGIPTNPQAWLYTTAKNITFNIHKKEKYAKQYVAQNDAEQSVAALEFEEGVIVDGQLKMMFVCSHPAIPAPAQIALMLKILCGFSIAEIAKAFFSTKETINKRLVRGRKKMREANGSFELPKNITARLPIVLQAIYLLFTEGYSPAEKNQIIRYDLCVEVIRLAEIVVNHKAIEEKADVHALLALMYLNVSRFKARVNEAGEIIEMENQQRTQWNADLILQGLDYLHKATEEERISKYLLLATISANHCTAPSFEQTNWKEILSLYDGLIALEDSPIARLNRSVALSMVAGNLSAIAALQQLASTSDISEHYLFHLTLAEFYKREKQLKKAHLAYLKSLQLCSNERDKKFIERKIEKLVPIS